VDNDARVKALFTILAVTDPAPIFVTNKTGVEDELISLNGIFVLDEDQDGSETLTIQLSGVPAGAVLFAAADGNTTNIVHSNLVQLTNAGSDPADPGKQVWTFNVDQSKALLLKPPLDFAGDMTLQLSSTSMELSTLEVVTVSKVFTVSVLPDADDVSFYSEPSAATVNEGDNITVNLYATTQETIANNETVVLTVRVLSSSSGSALLGLVGIEVDGKTALFTEQGGNKLATIVTNAATIDSFQIITGDDAFGVLDLDISVGSRDTAAVGGVTVEDITDPADLLVTQLSVDIMPLPDAPVIELYSEVIISGSPVIPFQITVNPTNPADIAPYNEEALVAIKGLPTDATFNISSSQYSQEGDYFIFPASVIDELAFTNASEKNNYQLTIEGRARIDAEEDIGLPQTLLLQTGDFSSADNNLQALDGSRNTLIGGVGNDILTGGIPGTPSTPGTSEDTFLFRLDDLAADPANARDTIFNFDRNNDHIDLSNIAAAGITATDLDSILNFQEDSGHTEILINRSVDKQGSITLDGVTKEDLYGGFNGSTPNETEIIQKLLDDNVLLTG
jgi:hypothetical protein